MALSPHTALHPAAVRCDMVLHQAVRARRVRKTGIGGEVRHGVTSAVSCQTSKTWNVTPHLHREYMAMAVSSLLAGTVINIVLLLQATMFGTVEDASPATIAYTSCVYVNGVCASVLHFCVCVCSGCCACLMSVWRGYGKGTVRQDFYKRLL